MLNASLVSLTRDRTGGDRLARVVPCNRTPNSLDTRFTVICEPRVVPIRSYRLK
jgi:hypothetical protein